MPNLATDPVEIIGLIGLLVCVLLAVVYAVVEVRRSNEIVRRAKALAVEPEVADDDWGFPVEWAQ